MDALTESRSNASVSIVDHDTRLRMGLEERLASLEVRLQQVEDRLVKAEHRRQQEEDVMEAIRMRRQHDEDRIAWGPEKRDDQISPSSIYMPNTVPQSSPFASPSRNAFASLDVRTNGNGNGLRISPPPFVPQMNGDFFSHFNTPAKASLPEVAEMHDDRLGELLRNPQAINLLSSLVQGTSMGNESRGNGSSIFSNNAGGGLRRSNSNKSRRSTRRFSCPDTSRISNNWSSPPGGYHSRTASFVGMPSEGFSEGCQDDAFLPNDAATRHGHPIKELEIIRRFGEVGTGPGQMNAPHGFCLGRDGEIIVADTNNHRIQFFDKNGTYVSYWGVSGKRDGQLWYPRKVAYIHENARVVVCDRGQDRSRLQIFTRFGHHERTIVVDYVAIVAGMTVYRNQIVIVDSVNPACIVLDQSGGLNFWFSCQKNMKEPSDVVVANNMFYICDFKGHCVCAYNGRGEFLSQIGSNQSINFPNGISVTSEGQLLVGDSHGNRFHVATYAADGRFLAEYECPHMKVSRCCGLVLTSQGHIVTIAKNNNFVLVLNRSDCNLQTSDVLSEREDLDHGSQY